jgi:outer membrane beta-barrel protein
LTTRTPTAAKLLLRAATLLAVLGSLAGLGGCALWPFGHHPEPDTSLPSDEKPGEVIDPDIARREVKVPKIRSQDFELGLYTGLLNAQDLESHLIYGVRAAYHVTEDFFIEADYGRSSVSDDVRREIGQPFFTEPTIGLNTYSVNLGYNVLPGEVFAGTRYAMTSTLYLLAGVGNTSFDDQDFLTYNVGFGLKVLPRDWISVRLEARDLIWKSDLLGASAITTNLETTLGVAFYY